MLPIITITLFINLMHALINKLELLEELNIKKYII